MPHTATMPTQVSCIIPTYNEGPRIEGVLRAVVGHPLVGEVIVVDDGSTDDTAQILQKRPEITLITYPDNRGKTYALMLGLQKASQDVVMTIDADLVGLRADDITRLITPVLRDEADMTMSIRSNSMLIYKMLGIDFVSGERVLRKDMVGDLDSLSQLPSFAFECYLNEIAMRNNSRIKVVEWARVIAPRKANKYGFWAGTLADVHMCWQIVRYISVMGIIRQFYYTARRRV